MPLTADQLALRTHLETLNAKAKAWMEAAEGRWASMFVTDLAHWAGYEIFTVAEFERYETMALAYELHKDRYGFKPNWSELKRMPLEELDAMIERLSAIPVTEDVAW
jgi:hypothetical protein